MEVTHLLEAVLFASQTTEFSGHRGFAGAIQSHQHDAGSAFGEPAFSWRPAPFENARDEPNYPITGIVSSVNLIEVGHEAALNMCQAGFQRG